MEVHLHYNKQEDEFSRDLSLGGRVRNYIKKNFYPAYAIAMLAPVYLVGGAIRDLLYAKKPKDLDFVVLGSDNLEWVQMVLEKYAISYTLNRFGGFKFQYNGVAIDLWLAEDLFSSMQYNVDGLFFDVRNNSLLSFTFNDFLQNGVRLVNGENNIEKGRELKLSAFEKKIRKENIK